MIYTTEFVKFIPEEIKENTLYFSEEFATLIHKCPCGCGEKVVITVKTGKYCKEGWEKGWELEINDNKISLSPSLLNRFKCKSHYFIKNSEIIFCK